ncbi:MAG: hypothetical protein FGF48_10195 [Candidatus Brockarchaeota archaeon]|nr:hypothetical protein [Candidatus Brockarchaeota archaeon]
MSRKYDKPEIKEKYEPYIEKSFYFKSPEETELKWGIRSSGGFPDVYGDIKGDIFLSCELDKVRITSEEVDKIWEMSLNRESWSELERKYKRFVRWLKHADEVAKKVTEKTGIKTILHIPHPEEGDRFSLIAMFNPKGMSDEEKMKMIEKAIDAVEEARKGL